MGRGDSELTGFGQEGFDVPFGNGMKLRFMNLGPRIDRYSKKTYTQYAVHLGFYVVADAHEYPDHWEMWVVGKGVGYSASFATPEEFALSLQKGAAA